MSSTCACKNGSRCHSRLRRARHAPSIITRSTRSDTRKICVTRATVPISYRSFFLRLLHADLTLGDEKNLLPVFHGALKRVHRDRTLEVKARVHAREHIEPAHGDDRKIFLLQVPWGFSL